MARDERRLAAILAADVVGYSRLMSVDESGTLARFKLLRSDHMEPAIQRHGGRVVGEAGDSLLVEFGTASAAVTCAVEVQTKLAELNAGLPDDRRMQFRMGVNLGEVIVDGSTIHGDGVNIAARLEKLAEPGGLVISHSVHDQIKGKLPYSLKDLGKQTLHNIAEPVEVYRVSIGPPADGSWGGHIKRPSRYRWGIGAAAVILALAGLAVGLRSWERRVEVETVSGERAALPLPEKPSIAILPFYNMSDESSQEYFADGMADDLITDLSKIPGLFVIARNSSFAYKGQQVDVRQVAEELGVRYVLEGSARRSGNQVRINVQLIDASTGGHLWAERFDGTLDDVFAFQDQVREKIVGALAVNLPGEATARPPGHGTSSAAAHDAYLQGWAYYTLLTPQDLARAVPFFEEAIRLDPDYAQAHAALAAVYWDSYVNNWAFDLGMPSFRAESRANEHLAAALTTPTPLAHAVQSRIYAALGFLDQAVAEGQKAVALDGNDATVLAGLAKVLVLAEHPAEALDFIEQAMRLDPHYPPSYLITLGAAQFGLERFDDAAATFGRAVVRNPHDEMPMIYLASSYGHLGRIDDADDAIETANALRARSGMGDLSLEKKDTWPSPFAGEIDFKRFGEKSAQERLRAGLVKVPALTWQYLITVHPVTGVNTSWWEVEGASAIDLPTAKSLYDRGVVFVDTSDPDDWAKAHILGSINISNSRSNETGQSSFSRKRLIEMADKQRDLVFYCTFKGMDCDSIWAVAKAVIWGYQKVYWIKGGLPSWIAAGYPVEGQ